jgi:hypothetical protein
MQPASVEYGPFVSNMQPASVHSTDLSFLTEPASIHSTDPSFLTFTQPRYTGRTFRFSHEAGIDIKYGHTVSHMHPASVQYGPFVSQYSRPRYTVRKFRFSHAADLGTVRTFRFSHAAGLGTQYGTFVSHMQPAAVHSTDLSFLMKTAWV